MKNSFFAHSSPARRMLFSSMRNILERIRSHSFDQAQASAIEWEASPSDLARIPKSGGVILAINRALTRSESLALISLLRSVRSVKIIADGFEQIAALNDALIPRDEAVIWVKDGGALVISPPREKVDDDFIARMIRCAHAPAIPVLLAEPTKGKAAIRIGNPVSFERLDQFPADADMAAYLNQRALWLESRNARKARRAKRKEQAIAPPPSVDSLIDEIESLPAEQSLIESGEFLVLHAEAEQIPCLMEEIGRLREISFRLAGEGTGRSLDLDEFDEHYLHLFVWSRETCEVVGAYRLGLADELITRFGPDGLYTTTLFDYRPGLLARLGSAIEMGRSFVRPEYQKNFLPLFLLWKGIGQFVASEPRYKILFGPVSISDDYLPASRHLMIEFLSSHYSIPELARCVKAKTPFRAASDRMIKIAAGLACDIEEMSALVADIEDDNKGIPVLLRQYLKLGGELIGFNVDRNFSDSLDGLILVDLTQTDRRILERFLGEDGAANFLSYHDRFDQIKKMTA